MTTLKQPATDKRLRKYDQLVKQFVKDGDDMAIASRKAMNIVDKESATKKKKSSKKPVA